MKVFRAVASKFSPQKISLRDLLMKMSSLEESVCKDAATKGAVWIQKNGKGKILRIRDLNEMVAPQDKITFNYDKRILSFQIDEDTSCLYEDKNYGIWIKPVGVLSQGTQASDHTSLLRMIEIKKRREIFLVHRLDRETEGLMIFAYSSKAAAILSDLFQKDAVKKVYEAIVLGEMGPAHQGTINVSLDDKEAITHYEVLESKNGQSRLLVRIETGRLHQIRRHLDHIGHPIMGDPKYGKGNKNQQGLKLLAKSLEFYDPWLQKEQAFKLLKSLTI